MPHSADSSSSSALSHSEDNAAYSTRSTSVSSANAHAVQPISHHLLTSSSREPLAPGIVGFRFDNPPHAARDDDNSSRQSERRPTMSKVAKAAPMEVKQDSNRRRSRWYEDQFGYKDDHVTASKEHISKQAPVIAELKTNVIVKDEYTLVTDLSAHLAERYYRPQSSVMIELKHSACLMYGGTFDPAYFLTITALPEFVQPITNVRNASLIQGFMQDVLGVSSERGVVQFKAVPEENMSVGGKTVYAMIEASDEAAGIKNRTSRSVRKSLIGGDKRKSLMRRPSQDVSRRASVKSTKSLKTRKESTEMSSPPLPTSDFDPRRPLQHPNGSTTNFGLSLGPNGKADPARPASRKKSILKMSGHDHDDGEIPSPPPIPQDMPHPAQKIGKRKSLIAMFKR